MPKASQALIPRSFRGMFKQQPAAHIMPEPGTVLFCGLGLRGIHHSGIYIGDDGIVELARNGIVRVVHPDQFTRPTNIGAGLGARAAIAIAAPGAFLATLALSSPFDAMNIYASCRGQIAVGNPAVARRARSMIGKSRPYHIIKHNCHHFTFQCLTALRWDTARFLPDVMREAERHLGADTWHVWNPVD